MTTRETQEWELQMERDRVILKEGISDDALKVLKRHFRFDLPAFQFREGNVPIPGDGQTLALMAATRDGAREVIQYIETVRSMRPLDTRKKEIPNTNK